MFALVNQPVVHANRRNKQTARVQASEGSEGYGSSSDTPRFSLRMTPPLPRTADRCDYQGDPGLCGCAAVARALPVSTRNIGTVVAILSMSACLDPHEEHTQAKNQHKREVDSFVECSEDVCPAAQSGDPLHEHSVECHLGNTITSVHSRPCNTPH